MPDSPWLIVAMDQRLLCLKQERFGRKEVDVRGDQITGVRHKSRMRSYQITIETPQGNYRIRIAKTDAFRFIGALSPLVPRPAIHDVSAPALLPGMATITGSPWTAGASVQDCEVARARLRDAGRRRAPGDNGRSLGK